MSYCRFSSDNWKSDVYVYASAEDCYNIHVASNRTVGEAPEVPSLMSVDLETNPNIWLDAHKAQMEWLEKAKRNKIDLPYAGESFCEESPKAAVARLKELQQLGYHVPQHAIERLQEEIDS